MKSYCRMLGKVPLGKVILQSEKLKRKIMDNQMCNTLKMKLNMTRSIKLRHQDKARFWI